MKEKPRIYQNKTNKIFNNNREVYTSYDSNNTTNVDIRKKIKDIINSRNFIYSKLVNIVIGNEIITRKIVGIQGNNLITIDNESIPINNIKDIYIK